MIKPPKGITTMQGKREWLERQLPIPSTMKHSPSYQTLTNEAKIILMLMMSKERGGKHAGSC